MLTPEENAQVRSQGLVQIGLYLEFGIWIWTKLSKTAEKVEAIEDEFCTDELQNQKFKQTKSVGSQTLERGPLPTTPFKPGFEYSSLQYDILLDCD